MNTESNIPLHKHKSIAGIRLSALFEISVPLVVLLLLDYFILGHTRYWAVNPHPFWFVVLLIACKYGTREALIAAIASSIALLAGNLPEQSMNQDGYAYLMMVLKLPLLWLVSAVLFGELRQMHIRERNILETALQESQIRAERIATSYQSVKSLKDQLETQIAGQMRSSIMAYHAAKSMETLNHDEVIKGLEEMVSATLHPDQFSAYKLDDKGLNAVLTHGWTESDKYLRHFGDTSALYEAIVGRHDTLCVVNAQQEKLLAGEGIIAGPLVDRESEEIVGMLKIEKLGFTDLHLTNIEAFTALCEWAGMAITNARKYEAAKSGGIMNPDHNLFSHGYFKHHSDFITALSKRVNFDVSMIAIKLTHPERFDSKTRMHIARTLSDLVSGVLRNVDLAFDHQEQNGEYSIILPATNRQGAEVVIKKIHAALGERVKQLAPEITFTIQTIYEKRA